MKSTIFSLLLSASYALAHGIVTEVTIDGKVYKGNLPNANPNPSIIRQVNDVGPVKGANNPDIVCGLSAKNAALVADANPGSTITFDWRGGDNSNWPHNTGPMMTYLASCGDQTCDKFDASQAKWFKISQAGRKPDGSWYQADLMKGGKATTTLPKTLAPGNYLVRHEIIALHLAVTLGGAEFYPACAQIRVSGSQAGKATAAELVSFPGAYKDNDPGIFDKNIFDPSQDDYVFPGPQIAAFADGTEGTTGAGSGSGSGSGNNGGDDTYSNVPSGTSSTSTSKPTSSGSANSSSSSSSGTKTCKLKRRSSSDSASPTGSASGSNDNASYSKRLHRRHTRSISRVMRDLLSQ